MQMSKKLYELWSETSKQTDKLFYMTYLNEFGLALLA